MLSGGAPWIRNACEEAFPGQKAAFVLDLCHALNCADARWSKPRRASANRKIG